MAPKIMINEDQLRIFETVPDLYLVLSHDLQILTASNAYLDATFTVREEIAGEFIFDVFPDNPDTPKANSVSNVEDSLKKVLATGKPHQMALQRYDVSKPETKGGFEKKYWQPIHTPVLDDQENVLYIIQKVTDVTRQVEADARIEYLQEQQRQDREETERQRKVLHDLFMEAPAPIVILEGEEMVYQLVNPAYQQIFPGRELLGKPLSEALPELEGTEIPAILDKVYRTGETFVASELPLMIARYEGASLQKIYCTFTYQARRNQQGNINGIFVFANEVTEQVNARKKIEESQEELKRFKFMAEQAREAFILMREDGSFAYLNKKALEAWGYTEKEIQHLRVPDVDPVYQQEAFLQLFARAQKEAIPQFETLHRTKEGHIYPVEVNVVRLRIGEQPYLFAIARDISKHKLAEEEMKEKNAQLTVINNDLDNFIYTASHDLKAPISNIEGLLHVLLKTLPPECLASDRTRHITTMMQESVERFKKTIANLTEIVKLQKENSAEAVMVNLPQVIEEVRLDLEQLIQSSGAQLEVDVSDFPCIHFSEKNLRSVVYNLLSNAIKYRAPERVPRVQVTCKSTSDYYVLSVKDNGLGIDPRRTDQLFTMFKRFHSHIEGTGIGLYMVKKMVENASGRIEVESQPGEGTTFRIYFKC